MTVNVLAFDFGGVLDIPNSHRIRESEMTFKIRKQMDADKAFMFYQLALKHDAKIVCISDLSKYLCIGREIINAIIRSDKPEHQELKEFLKTNKRTERKRIIEGDDGKQKTIDTLAQRYADEDLRIVAFEDSVKLENCHFIWVSTQDKLTPEDIANADKFLSEGA